MDPLFVLQHIFWLFSTSWLFFNLLYLITFFICPSLNHTDPFQILFLALVLILKTLSSLSFLFLNSCFSMIYFFWICDQDVQHVAEISLFPCHCMIYARGLPCTFKDGTLRKRKSYTTDLLWKSTFRDSLSELPWNICLALQDFSLISQYTPTTILNLPSPSPMK